jgi:hypothetical protein
MMGRLRFLLIGLAIFIACAITFAKCEGQPVCRQILGFDPAWLCFAGSLILAPALVIFFMPYEVGRSRQAADDEYVQDMKRLGLMPLSESEALAEESAERQNYNDHMRSIAAWAGKGSRYTDYDGWLIDYDTNRKITWIGNQATGKTRPPRR